MLFWGIIAKTKRCFYRYKITGLRALSLKSEVIPKVNETVPRIKKRRFVKPQTTRELKPFDSEFVINLFKGKCSKEIFEYPLIFGSAELESVIRHSAEVEHFFQNNPNVQINTDTLEEFKKLELFGLSIPQEYGGAGYSLTETKFLIECCGINGSAARFIGYCDDIGSRLLSLYGTEEQKKKYLPRLASGESNIALAYLETGPLVDFSSFEGSVIVDYEKNGFIVNAKKKWVHHAQSADLILVLAKTSVIHEEEEIGTLGFNFFITEKASPGISVHQLKSGCAKDFDLYEVDFKNVFIANENKLGSDPTAGYLMLQNACTHRELTNAVICCALIKRMIHSILFYCEKKVINENPIKYLEHIQISVAYLSAYAYALESVIYLITSRFDSHIEPNLFHEGILAKVFAVDMLELAIQKYIQILGHDSFKNNEILEEALKVLHYSNVFDENNTYLKLIVSTAGLMNVKPSMISLVKKLRRRYDYPVEALKYYLSLKSEKISEVDPKLGIKGELHGVFSSKGDILEKCLMKLKVDVENHLISAGSDAFENEFMLIKYAEMVTYIYALAASLARGSTAFCYDLKNSEHEIPIVLLIADIIEAKFEQLDCEVRYISTFGHYYKEVGRLCFIDKGYSAEHPLSRSY